MSDLAASDAAGSVQATARETRAHLAGRRPWATAALLAVALAGGVAAAVAAGAFGGSGSAPGVGSDPYHTGTALVRRQSLMSQTQLQATLGETGSYSVVNQAQGIITALPSVGAVIRQGHALYAVDGAPVVLLYGSVPAWRDLTEGMSGADVAELNCDLVQLGYASPAELGAGADYFSVGTASALQQLQTRLGVAATGTLTLGQAVFLPTAALITGLGQGVVTGGQAMPGGVLLSASSTRRLVTIALDPSMQSELKTGDKVSITLPGGQVTPGAVSSVAAVAAVASGATIAVQVTPTRPAALGHLEQAPVQVTITTASVNGALVVPVDALLAQADGTYAVEVAGPHGRRLVPVSTGLFDEAAGLVQVTGQGLAAGQRVVVPSI
jgi:multidrug efflux pump subunit AcrA (membrane-fusion protein)